MTDFLNCNFFPRGEGNGEIESPLNLEALQEQNRFKQTVANSADNKHFKVASADQRVHVCHRQCASISNNLCHERWLA